MRLERLRALVAPAGLVSAALVGAALLAGCGGGGGGANSNVPSAKNGAQYEPMKALPVFQPAYGGHSDPDTYAKGGNDANTVLAPLGGGRYRLTIQNTSQIGALDNYNWVPPVGLTVTSVVSQTTGHCAVQTVPVGPGRTPVAQIACNAKLAPPKCTCRPGGTITIIFKGTRPPCIGANSCGYVFGTLMIGGVTISKTHIPSYEGGPTATSNADVGFCKAGQTPALDGCINK
jgi:hypothetical protein